MIILSGDVYVGNAETGNVAGSALFIQTHLLDISPAQLFYTSSCTGDHGSEGFKVIRYK